jgi:hypothetical protein
MARLRRLMMLVPAVGLALAAGCDTARPGLGVTNGPAPGTTEEKPAMRTDLPAPTTPGPSEAASAASGGSYEGGTGGRGTGASDPANPPGRPPAAPREVPGTVSATPPTVESPSASGAQGATKPPENINTGTPRSPQ